MEQIPCPNCLAELNPYDRRDRTYRDGNGDRHCLSLRRLRCGNKQCRRIHTELPDSLIPYKRYAASVVEAVLSGTADNAPEEETTRRRWREWYRRLSGHFQGVVTAVRRHLEEIARTLLASPKRTICEAHLSDEPVLAELVRLTVNTGNWITTRSAMVTEPCTG